MQREISLDEYAFEGFNANLDQIAGRDNEKQQFLSCIRDQSLDNMLYISNCSMFLVTGPVGYGKIYLTLCFAQTLQEEGYLLYYIDCEDIMDEERPEEVWKSLLGEIVEKTNPDGDYEKKMFIYLEHLEALSESRKCTKIVASLLQELYSANCQCIIVSTSIDGLGIPTILLKKFIVFELELPNEKERTEYFKNCLGFEVENPDDEDEKRVFYPLSVTGKSDNTNNGQFDEQELESLAMYCAKKTEGLSFAELDRVVLMLFRSFKMKLQTLTESDVDQVFYLVEAGEGYFIEPDEFEEIISRVKRAGRMMNPTSTKGVPVENSTEPKIIYIPTSSQVLATQQNPNLIQNPAPNSVPEEVDENGMLVEEENPRVADVVNKYKRVPRAREIAREYKKRKQ